MNLDVRFSQAKDGSRIFSVDSVLFHSSYAPQKEAERFVGSLDFPFEPKIVLLVEPGLDYARPFLRKRFPGARIGIIRILTELKSDNGGWDFVLDYKALSFSAFGETELLSTVLAQPQASARCFKAETAQIRDVYKAALEKAKTLLVTREVFEKKWLLNTVSFLRAVRSYVTVRERLSVPIVIAASGPSLWLALDVLKAERTHFFLIALSSALLPLLRNGLVPDMCLSTDGGYWAGAHLDILRKKNPEFVLALTPESRCTAQLVKKCIVLPLSYPDGISGKIMRNTTLPFMRAERNGTVSGTAMELALGLTEKQVFMCGLDLAARTGFQHIQPNALELGSSITENRIHPKELRLASSRLNSGSLKIYRQWFDSFTGGNNRVFRVLEASDGQKRLCSMEDLGCAEFARQLRASGGTFSSPFTPPVQRTAAERAQEREEILRFIQENSRSAEWKEQLFPLKSVYLSHCRTDEEKAAAEEAINQKNRRLTEKLLRLLSEDADAV